MHRPLARAAIGVGATLLATPALAGFTNSVIPPFRGQDLTEFSGWECFSQPDGGENFPDDPNSTSDDARIRQLSPGAIITSTCNIYSPAAKPLFVLEDSVPQDLQEVVLQLRTLGVPLDTGSPTLTYVDAGGGTVSVPFDGYASLAMGEDMFSWDLSGIPDDILAYRLEWSGTDANMSLDAVLLDTRFDTVGDAYCAAQPNSTGFPATLVGLGSTDVGANDLTLVAADLPINQNGYLINSMMQDFVQNPGGSQGDLCLGGQIGRHTKQLASSGLVGVIETSLDLAALPRPGGTVVVLPGDTWNFQLWYRDKNPDTTSNFTEAISITFQ